MTTQWLNAVPVDETLERAKTVKFSGFLKTAFFGIFFIIGWTAGRAWLTVVFCGLAVSEGWREGTGRKPAEKAPERQLYTGIYSLAAGASQKTTAASAKKLNVLYSGH